jgi:hypothetical protein
VTLSTGDPLSAPSGTPDQPVAVLDPGVVSRVDTGSRVAPRAAGRAGAAEVAREFVVQGHGSPAEGPK